MTHSFHFTKTLACILIANLLVFICLNTFQLPSSWLLILYPLATAFSAILIKPIRFRQYLHKKEPLLYVFLGGILLLLTLPRLGYLTDFLPHALSTFNWDDESRIGHLISMTLSPSYPLQHFANPDYLFSYYYSSYYPWVFAKLCLPFISLKAFIFFGNLLYHILFLGSLYELSKCWFSKRNSRLFFLFGFIGFSGFDWVMNMGQLLGHSEWWQRELFHANTQISSTFTSLFWSIHHSVGLLCTPLAVTLFFKAKFKSKELKLITVLTLLVAGFYTSPFSIVAAPLFALSHVKLLTQRILLKWQTYLILAIALLPLPVFMNKPTSISFGTSSFRVLFTNHFITDKLLSLPIFLTLVPIIEIAGLPLLLFFSYNAMTATHKRYFYIAWGFLLITYFVALSGFNILSMRGMLLPSMVFFYLFAYYIPTVITKQLFPLVIVLLLGSSIGLLRDTATYMRSTVGGNTLTYFAKPSLQSSIQSQRSKDIVTLVQHPELLKKVKTTPKAFLPTISPYQAEQFQEKPLSTMTLFEIEALRTK